MSNIDGVINVNNPNSKLRRGRSSGNKELARQERIPLGIRFSKLTVPQRLGFERRWINDKPGRIEAAKLGGWSLVIDLDLKVGNVSENGNSELGHAISRVVGLHAGGNAMKGYLMEIPKEWYNEDQNVKRKKRMEIQESILRGDDRYKIQDEKGQNVRGYVPLSGNQITS